ncbi:inorganic diphosphatase [Buchnera aphidicola]|uniref:Inorganic pyrophosphatase n=1 Tax=Buchnera aphidicola (Cinara strobi) TaxID=1921549 RepID=A0A3B1DVJ9_9GAMM|nr:inorganic diphosphatase [Buchnera aphidicola]VAX76283.1 Inorganic pyrophosphatase [Buchnera aphidicola (Cinara strobi)]
MNNINNIPSGKNAPHEIYVIIEIPAFSYPIKYEINKSFKALYVDRFIPTNMFYPCNYGFINQTLALDGDPLDVLIPTPYPIQSTSVIRCIPVGVLEMEDESGNDEKILAVPHKKITKEYKKIHDIDQISKSLKQQIIYFFENYKNLEKNKWTKVKGWKNFEEAKYIITKAINRYHIKNNNKKY